MATMGLWFLAAYISAFLVAAYQNKQFLWVIIIMWLWLLGRMMGLWYLSEIWVYTHLNSLARLSLWHLPYFYVVLASVWVFARRWRKLPQSPYWQLRGIQPFLSVFAVSGVLQTLAFVLLLGLVAWQFPHGLTPYVLPALVQMYVFEPVYWVSLQAMLMLIFYIHRVVINNQSASEFSSKQLQAGFLLALLLQVAYVVASLLKIGH